MVPSGLRDAVLGAVVLFQMALSMRVVESPDRTIFDYRFRGPSSLCGLRTVNNRVVLAPDSGGDQVASGEQFGICDRRACSAPNRVVSQGVQLDSHDGAFLEPADGDLHARARIYIEAW